jgi:hypothetical protein
VTVELVEPELVHSIVGGFYAVYNYYGYGFAEGVYAGALECELKARGHRVAREVSIAIEYWGRRVAWQRLDLLVDSKVIVEMKACEVLPRVARQQLLNYLRATPFQVGLLLHFGPRPAFERFVDTRPRHRGESASPLAGGGVHSRHHKELDFPPHRGL